MRMPSDVAGGAEAAEFPLLPGGEKVPAGG